MRSDCAATREDFGSKPGDVVPTAIAIISIAQQASPNCAGQIAERLAHWISHSSFVVSSGSSGSRP